MGKTWPFIWVFIIIFRASKASSMKLRQTKVPARVRYLRSQIIREPHEIISELTSLVAPRNLYAVHYFCQPFRIRCIFARVCLMATGGAFYSSPFSFIYTTWPTGYCLEMGAAGWCPVNPRRFRVKPTNIPA